MEINEIRDIVQEVLDNDNFEIKMNTRLKEDLGLCSFDMMLILGIIEEKYNEKINIDILLSNMTVKGLIDSIE